MSGCDAVDSGGSDCQSFSTRSYSAWLNASVASRSMAELVDDVGVRASVGGRLTTIVPRVSSGSIRRWAVIVQRRALCKGSDRQSFTMLRVCGPWLGHTDCRRTP